MRVLVVDDEPAIRLALVDLLEADGESVRAAEHAPAALAMLEDEPADLIMSDLKMPVMDGLQLLDEVLRRHPDSAFVLMTAHGDERVAVRALRAGAWDYLPKPYDNEEVRALVRRVRETLALRAENVRLREELSRGFGEMIGEAPAMREVWRIIRRAGPTSATVLITGESGTGKELAARAIHAVSERATGPFIALNCSALPADLIESEMFGHLQGAFTGAVKDREGLFHAARSGTLFLDEAGDLSLSAQAKLLRVLEQRSITRVGSTREEAVDVRIIAATNHPLEALVEAGRFREDLLYRLRVVTLQMPPLRDRRGDILPMAIHFIAEFGRRYGRQVSNLTEAARRALVAHDWPGNVRELRNAIERAVVLVEGETMDAADLPVSVRGTAAPLAPAEAVLADLPFTEARERAVEAFERAFIGAALERHGGNVSATARAIGLHRQSLQKVMRRLGLQDPSPDG